MQAQALYTKAEGGEAVRRCQLQPLFLLQHLAAGLLKRLFTHI